ncbi:hypothetical protein [Sphingobium lignivorans]|uniref:Uncharacterized protein n=1 Tax=Sphingobium lignivorans TaxID=2735886 RepID=A0ABR6NHH7_9SPHN|nr:hypothetical protein [Sphingobium lignivorans]MBB5985973.1 hypothetical protein [Sphingobium lignivorans]
MTDHTEAMKRLKSEIAKQAADLTITEDADGYANEADRMHDWYIARDAAIAALDTASEPVPAERPKPAQVELGTKCQACGMLAPDKLSGDCNRPECIHRLRVATPAKPAQEVELYREIFITAHGDGWRGNQLRRDVQHVDAEKSWRLYVENGALQKAIERLASSREAELEQALIEADRKNDVLADEWNDALRKLAIAEETLERIKFAPSAMDGGSIVHCRNVATKALAQIRQPKGDQS